MFRPRREIAKHVSYVEVEDDVDEVEAKHRRAKRSRKSSTSQLDDDEEQGAEERNEDEDGDDVGGQSDKSATSLKKSKQKNLDGCLEKLFDLPLDLLVEIMSYVRLEDMLELSRAAPSLKKILAGLNARPLWKAARREMRLPDVPDLIEEDYAALLTDRVCSECSQQAWIRDFFFRAIFCHHCYAKALLPVSKLQSAKGNFHPKTKDCIPIKKCRNAVSEAYPIYVKWYELETEICSLKEARQASDLLFKLQKEHDNGRLDRLKAKGTRSRPGPEPAQAESSLESFLKKQALITYDARQAEDVAIHSALKRHSEFEAQQRRKRYEQEEKERREKEAELKKRRRHVVNRLEQAHPDLRGSFTRDGRYRRRIERDAAMTFDISDIDKDWDAHEKRLLKLIHAIDAEDARWRARLQQRARFEDLRDSFEQQYLDMIDPDELEIDFVLPPAKHFSHSPLIAELLKEYPDCTTFSPSMWEVSIATIYDALVDYDSRRRDRAIQAILLGASGRRGRGAVARPPYSKTDYPDSFFNLATSVLLVRNSPYTNSGSVALDSYPSIIPPFDPDCDRPVNETSQHCSYYQPHGITQIVKILLTAADLDPSTTTIDEMDELGPTFRFSLDQEGHFAFGDWRNVIAFLFTETRIVGEKFVMPEITYDADLDEDDPNAVRLLAYSERPVLQHPKSDKKSLFDHLLVGRDFESDDDEDDEVDP